MTDARYACYCRIVTILSGSVTLGIMVGRSKSLYVYKLDFS